MTDLLGTRGRLARAIKKKLVHTRWMGVSLAVYEICLPNESEVRFERTCARGTKRRGKRSGLKKVRKCRSLAAADPVSIGPSPPQRHLRRRGYIEDRGKKYVEKRLRALVKLDRLIRKIDQGKASNLSENIFESDAYKHLRSSRNLLFGRIVALSASLSGDSYEFAKIRLGVVVTVMDQGYAALDRRGDFNESDDSPLEVFTGIDDLPSQLTRKFQSYVRLVEVVKGRAKTIEVSSSGTILAERTLPLASGVKTRRRVARAPHPRICRFCGSAPCRLPGVNAKGMPMCKPSCH